MNVRILTTTCLLLVLAACGGDSPTDTGETRVPLVGSYDYAFVWQHPHDPAGTPARTLAGTMILTHATEDSIAGSWSVTFYDTDMSLGFWNVDAYVVYASMTGATITHRLARQTGSNNLNCEAGILLPTSTGFLRQEGTCRITWINSGG